jgi:hypothetical protein
MFWVCEPMFDGSGYPKSLMQMFQYLPVLRYQYSLTYFMSLFLRPIKASKHTKDASSN